MHEHEQEGEELPDLLRPRTEPMAAWKRALCFAGAILLVIAGMAGWLVPVVTGIPFWIGGIVLLAIASQRTVGVVNRLERRLPETWRLKLRHGIAKVPIRKVHEHVNLAPDVDGRAEMQSGTN